MYRLVVLVCVCACGSVTPAGADADVDVSTVVDASTCAKPVTLAQGGMISRLAMDATDVYWLETDPVSALHRTPRAGGATETLATRRAGVLTLDADHVYFDDVTLNGTQATTTLYALPKAGGPEVPVASGSFGVGGLAVDASTLYFLELPTGVVAALPKVGGAPFALTSGTPAAVRLIGVDDSAVYWTSGHEPPNTIWATPTSRGMSRQLAQIQTGIGAVALDVDNIYFTTNQDLVKLSKASSALTTLASGLGEFGGLNLAVAGGLVYADQQAPGQYPAVILAVPVSGGPVQRTCAGGSMSISGLAVDATTIVWGLIYEANGALCSLPR